MATAVASQAPSTAAASTVTMEGEGQVDPNNALRFEDLTIDDDLPLLDRVVRYCRSGIALQRLVHVKMLAETSETVGGNVALKTLVPLLNPLVQDPESIIRQHLASQLLPLCLVCMLDLSSCNPKPSIEKILEEPTLNPQKFDKTGYRVVTQSLVQHLNTLLTDSDVDVRRSASESLSGLALHVAKEDVASVILPIPIALSESKQKKSMADGLAEELRIASATLLAELSGSSEEGHIPHKHVQQHVVPCILTLTKDTSFRVRRAAAQALPRVVGAATSVRDALTKVLPAFTLLSKDDMYRVRKSTGECLVDMSRSLMLLAERSTREEASELRKTRRATLIPIALQLLEDTNKFVRHGMMQFLGPFIASFYPFGTLKLPQDQVAGIVGPQFFPHASSMVSRLNSSNSTNTSSPTPTPATLDIPDFSLSESEALFAALPDFVKSNRLSYLSLRAVVAHRNNLPPGEADIAAIRQHILPPFCSLAKIKTADENTDAEMRVYCAYSFPAVVLIMGPNNWEGPLQECFLTLVNPNHGTEGQAPVPPPLPVKRCLASSLHTVCHILGPKLSQRDVVPVLIQQFIRDTDDSVRLNVLRNFPWLVTLLEPEVRQELVLLWADIVKGEDLLGAHKRSVTNPMLLNWRQRDYVARSLPDMMSLVRDRPTMAQECLWPILQMLLVDSVNVVRQDAEWAIPLLLRLYCAENLRRGIEHTTIVDKRWSADVCQDVVSWLKETILGSNVNKTINFGKRQLYCRICAAVGLALRFGDLQKSEQWDVSYRLNESLRNDDVSSSYSPYQTLSTAERKHLRRLLVYDLLPPALEMKDDRVTNVRLTLMKVLQVMPKDIKDLASVSEVLKELEEEVETWESFNSGQTSSTPQRSSRKESRSSSSAARSGSTSNKRYDMGENRAVV